MLIDTHCHLDAPELRPDRRAVIQAAGAAGVAAIVIPAVARFNFNAVRRLAHAVPGGAYALGIHPLYVGQSEDDDLRYLREELQRRLEDPRLVAIGEIGLDFFVPGLAEGRARERQEYFYQAQLDMAQELGLPVLLHVRRSQDVLLKYLRRRPMIGGIAHAFNGSAQQADMFIQQGFALGVGGAMTYARALQIRRLAAAVPLAHLVLETDAPDIPPAWLVPPDRRNTPAQVAAIARELAQLRAVTPEIVREETGATARRVLPRLGRLLA
ncbi:TatD family hydrolase [Kerstersia sp.]|uniref:TatD family hydrolase n=1 Tax=Kerstersia sp. TaxID=1930783 RepID=UPI003F90EBCA